MYSFKPTLLVILYAVLVGFGCSTGKTQLGGRSKQGPISNPFVDISNSMGKNKSDSSQNMILRTKKGDRAVELEIPGDSQSLSDFVLPVSPAFKNQDRSIASIPGDVDNSYKNIKPGLSDREIIQAMPQGLAQDIGLREELEKDLHLIASEDSAVSDKAPSYLAAIDRVKQLYHGGRYEAALIEADDLLKVYQTDPKIYEMRGTLLDRLGRRDLAVRSWHQSLKLNPNNKSLRRYVERRQVAMSGGSP